MGCQAANSDDMCNGVLSTMTAFGSAAADANIQFTEGLQADPWGTSGAAISETGTGQYSYYFKALESYTAPIRTLLVVSGWRNAMASSDPTNNILRIGFTDSNPEVLLAQDDPGAPSIDWVEFGADE